MHEPKLTMPRSNARLVRFAIFALVLIFCGFVLAKGLQYDAPAPEAAPKAEAPQKADAPQKAEAPVDVAKPLKEEAKVSRPAGKKGTVKATFVSLVRNSDLPAILQSISYVETRFNLKYHYDWVFLNDVPFEQEFERLIRAVVSGTAKFGVIAHEHWLYPAWIDLEKAALSREEMVRQKVIYGGSESYRHMCRYELGFFFRHELLQEYEYYWRVEPDVKIFCDIDYDVFQYMKDNDKLYGFTISLPEYKETIPTLWETTKKFMAENPSLVADKNNMAWISDDGGETYNGCHFWLNFEIAALKLWQGEAYSKYFDYLDKAGGFFYERWGDAPVHLIGASLFIPREKIHYFHDVGYFHVPFTNCPVDEETRFGKRCTCLPNDDFSWRGYLCTPKFFSVNGLQRPKGWERYTG